MALTTWHSFLAEKPDLLPRLARAMARRMGIPYTRSQDLSDDAAQNAAVSLLRRTTFPRKPYGYAKRTVRHALLALLPRPRRFIPITGCIGASAPATPSPQESGRAVRVTTSLSAVALEYLQVEADMPDAPASTKAAQLGVSTGSYRVGLCRARANAREALERCA